ncbi:MULTISPECIES: hypothetical protein [unclassified Nostoc]|uniref:hypothetical protein n=1 Tax=unclassified Nostoc TaxID=2593658 RepID=UPI00159F0E21|nr:hypothetical protein [Nostoc sp. KVJ20]
MTVISIRDINEVDYISDLSENEIEATRGGFVMLFLAAFAVGQVISQAQRKLQS